MWFPYSLPTSWKIEGDRQRANDSQLDENPREFLIACQLRNPISNEWSVELQLAERKSVKWRESDGNLIDISFFPNDEGRLSEVVCKLSDTRQDTAVERSHSAISTFLDFWSSSSGRGFSVAGVRAADLKHDARWRAMPHWPSALDLPFEFPEGLPANFWPLAQLYREGRTSSKDRYRFLCCYALIDKWSRAEGAFAWRKGTSPRVAELAHAPISREIMALSGAIAFAPELERLSIEDLPDALFAWRTKAISFAVEGRPDDTCDQFSSLQEWAAIANVADIAAHTTLSRTIAFWNELSPDGDLASEDPNLITQDAS